MANGEWSEWITYKGNNETDAPEGIPFAVYRNRLVDDNGNPVPINRPLATDPDGITYIGAAGIAIKGDPLALRKQISHHMSSYVRAMTQKAKDRRINHLWENLFAVYPNATMQFQYQICSSHVEVTTLEREMNDAFESKFGELPDDLWKKMRNCPERF